MKNKMLKGKKLNMSQVFLNDGKVIPVTIVEVSGSIEPDLNDRSVVVTGKSKGKGFAGTIKRWSFSKQPVTRGQSNKTRAPGAIGAQTPGRVFKGKKMAGHMGSSKVTVKGLKIIDVDTELNRIMVSGPIPGARNSEVLIKVL